MLKTPGKKFEQSRNPDDRSSVIDYKTHLTPGELTALSDPVIETEDRQTATLVSAPRAGEVAARVVFSKDYDGTPLTYDRAGRAHVASPSELNHIDRAPRADFR